MMHFDSLIIAIERAIESKKILVPSTDYYRRAGDSDEETIEFINPSLLLIELREMEQREGE
jgi:hypothetical protein